MKVILWILGVFQEFQKNIEAQNIKKNEKKREEEILFKQFLLYLVLYKKNC
jgi:hypothetical protein